MRSESNFLSKFFCTHSNVNRLYLSETALFLIRHSNGQQPLTISCTSRRQRCCWEGSPAFRTCVQAQRELFSLSCCLIFNISRSLLSTAAIWILARFGLSGYLALLTNMSTVPEWRQLWPPDLTLQPTLAHKFVPVYWASLEQAMNLGRIQLV